MSYWLKVYAFDFPRTTQKVKLSVSSLPPKWKVSGVPSEITTDVITWTSYNFEDKGTLIKFKVVPALNASGNYSLKINGTAEFDSNVAVGSVMVECDVRIPLPELSPDKGRIWYSQKFPTEGSETLITAMIANTGASWTCRNGTTDAYNVEVGFYDVYRGTKKLIGTETIASIGAGLEVNVTKPWKAEKAGLHEIRVMVDPKNKTAEMDEENNEAKKIIYVRTKPDLTITSDYDIWFSFPPRTIVCTEGLNFTYLGLNEFSARRVIEPPKTVMWPRPMSSEKREEWGKWFHEMEIPEEMRPELPVGGVRQAKVGFPKVVWEYKRIPPRPVIYTPPLPSFCDPYAVEGDNCTISVRIRNLGETWSPNTEFSVLIDGEAIVELTPRCFIRKDGYPYFASSFQRRSPIQITKLFPLPDLQLPKYESVVIPPTNYTDVPSVSYGFRQPGSTYKHYPVPPEAYGYPPELIWDVRLEGTSLIDVPWKAVAGRHEIKVIIDSGNKIEEINETNNVATREIYVMRKPDLEISPKNIVPSTQNPREGEIVKITANVHNLGEASVSGTMVEISEVDLESKEEKLLHKQKVCLRGTIWKVKEKRSVNISFDWIAMPDKVIKVSVDTENVCEEINEGNNVAEIRIDVIKPMPPWVSASFKPLLIQPGKQTSVEVSTTGIPGGVVTPNLTLSDIPSGIVTEIKEKKKIGDTWVFTAIFTVEEEVPEGIYPITTQFRWGEVISQPIEQTIFVAKPPSPEVANRVLNRVFPPPEELKKYPPKVQKFYARAREEIRKTYPQPKPMWPKIVIPTIAAILIGLAIYFFVLKRYRRRKGL